MAHQDYLGTTTASLTIDDCQAQTAGKRVRALGFMAEATLVQAKLSTGQHIEKTGINEAMGPICYACAGTRTQSQLLLTTAGEIGVGWSQACVA